MPLEEVCQQLQAACQSMQDLVRILIDSLWHTHTVQVSSGSKKYNGKAELDSG